MAFPYRKNENAAINSNLRQKKWPWNAVVPWPWFLFFALEVGEKMLGILLELFVVEDHAEAEGHGGD